MTTLPWAQMLLKAVRSEYSKRPPAHSETTQPPLSIQQYIQKTAEIPDAFDTLGLKADFAKALQENSASFQHSSCSHGTITVVTLPGDTMKPTWNTWWRAVRLLCMNPVRVIIFAHPKKRLAPPVHQSLEAEHVNGGMTMRCDAKTVIVYRKEEATRVLIHELFHANCSDPYNIPVPKLEADTEAWAELVLCAMAAKGQAQRWWQLFHSQMLYASQQAAAATKFYGLRDETDYSWRYLTGRLKVWEHLGLPVPIAHRSAKPLTSLRFTICEPEDI
jgi:hypothetical protein